MKISDMTYFLKGFHDKSCEEFETLFMIALNNYAPMKILFMMTLNNYRPMKIKYIRANKFSFMNNELSKAIMVRSRNKYLKFKQ